jgi:hypothetical protein
MHECPDCGHDCDCDLEDLWHDEPPTNCTHDCEEDDDDNDDCGY